MKKKKILLILTGGTISMDNHKDLSSDILHLQRQRLLTLSNDMLSDIDFDPIIFAMKPSPHMTPYDMLSLAKFIDVQMHDNVYEGFVITHGTDTLEETAFFLDLFFPALKFPIVVTGSMRNFSDIAYDGLNNIVSALLVSGHKDASRHGVLVVLNDVINTAREVTKSHTVSLDTFKSLDFGPIGVIDDYQILFHRHIQDKFHLPKINDIQAQVAIYKTYTGDDGSNLLNYESYDGLVIESFGRGNIPPQLVKYIKILLDAGTQIMITSRVPVGRVYGTYPYEGGGKQLHDMGCYLSPNLNSQKARLLMIYAISANIQLNHII